MNLLKTYEVELKDVNGNVLLKNNVYARDLNDLETKKKAMLSNVRNKDVVKIDHVDNFVDNFLGGNLHLN